MTEAQLRAAHHAARIELASNHDAAERAVAAGMSRAMLRSHQLAEHWREKVRLIEAVARKRGIRL